MLRTVYRAEGESVLQLALPPDECPAYFTVLDAAGWSAQELRERLADEARRPFDLAQGPVCRVTLFRQGADSHTLLLCAHHIALDLWSLLQLLQELRQVYQALAAGREPALPPVAAAYGDFAAWQSRYLASPAAEAAWRYWQARLGGELPLLALPTDKPRPAEPDYRGASVALWLERGDSEGLRQLARQQGVTLFTLLLAAYKTLLHRYTHQDDLIVGVPTSGRGQARFAALVGNLVNPLPLRSRPHAGLAFADYLAQVRDAWLAAGEHQDFPFSLLVERLQPERSAGHWPIYQTLFVLQQAQAGAEDGLAQLALGEDGTAQAWGEWTVAPQSIQPRVENFDLKVMAAESGNGLLFSFQYRSDLFDQASIQRLAGHFRRLLRGIALDPQTRLGELPLLSEGEKRTLAGWNATAADYPQGRCLHHGFEQQAEQTPDAVALVFQERRLSYRQLNERANRLAHSLLEQGLVPGTPVGIGAQRSLELVVGLLGILKAGGAYLPLEPDYPAERLAAMAEDAGLSLILAQPRFFERYAWFGGELLALDEDPAGASSANPGLALPDNSLAYVLFTSGSTGRPKGVAIPHRGIHNRLWWMQDYFGLDAGDAVLQKTPYTFDVSVWEFFWPLMVGSRLVLAGPDEHKEPDRLIDLIERHEISTVHFVPSMLNAFLAAEGLQRCEALRRVICSGEAVSVELQKLFFQRLGARFFNLYGPTEASVDVTAWECRPDDGLLSVPIGRPVANTRIHLLDESLNPVPVGVAGELHIGGVQLAWGYLNRPELSAERFVPDPFSEPGARLYKTGDLARYRPDGAIEYLGRIDHQVKIRGFRIELGEIEARLLAHPQVREAAVIAREDAPGAKRLVAYVVVDSNSQLDKDTVTPAGTAGVHGHGRCGLHAPAPSMAMVFSFAAAAVGIPCRKDEHFFAADMEEVLRAFLAEALPDYMVPSAFVMLERLPLSSNGKLERKALPAPDLAQRFAGRYAAPRNAVETELARIWADLLRLERVGIHDNFFELGGDSILSIQAASRARQAGIAFSPRQLFEQQTVAGLAQVAGQAAAVAGEQGPVSGAVPLTPIQHWFFQQEPANPHHWNQALLLELDAGLDAALLGRALEHLLVHHDALRLRFQRQDGVWRQMGLPHEAHACFQRVDLSHLAPAERRAALQAECTRRQTALHLSEGPLLQAVWFDWGAGDNPRLLLAIHHLAVDGVSWRILLEDLHSAYAQLSQGHGVALPAKSTSFKHWAERLPDLAHSEALIEQSAYWLESAESLPLPVDDAAGSLLEGDAARHCVALDEAETQQLLREAPAAYRLNVDDLLLTALAQTLAVWSGRDSVAIDREGHGREALFDDLDLSRSVGWFTSLYPLRLHLPADGSAAAVLKAAKTQLARLPGKGVGYGLLRYLGPAGIAQRLAAQPQAQVLFNYLGQLDQALAGAPWRFAAEETGPCRDPQAQRRYELEIDAQVSGGCLQLAWRYGAGRYRRETIECLAQDCLAVLRRLIAHCLAPEAGSLSPADFPLADLSDAALAALPCDQRGIEDIYPLAPMQEGMLFDTLMAPASGIYLMQDRFELEGLVNPDLMRRAWQAVLDRHGALRSGFFWESESRPCQIVQRRVELPFEYHDWRDWTPEEQTVRLERLLAEERRCGFDFRRPPLLAIRLFRLDEQRYRLVRSYHHILIDAWCMSLMLVEMRDHYEALHRNEAPRLAPAAQYGSYIAWLQGRDRAASEPFWRHYLQGFEEATPLQIIQPPAASASFGKKTVAPAGNAGAHGQGRCELHASAPSLAMDSGNPCRNDGPLFSDEVDQGVSDAIAFLSAQDTQRLNSLAQQWRLTPNTFVQAAWALLLGRYSSRSDVLFGVTVSGRPAELAGSETMLGVFINTLPLRVALDGRLPLLDFAQALLRRNLELRQYEYVPLVQIQGCSEVPREQPLFDSLLVFENYPVDPSLRSGAGLFRIVGVDTRTHTNYPLTGMVIPGERLHLQISYHRGRFDGAAVERMLGHFRHLLEDMIRHPDKRLEQLDMLAEDERRRILYDWNRTARDYGGAGDYAARFAEQARRTPQAIAVRCGGEALSYAELDRRAERMAAALAARGVGPESIVALLADRSVAFLTALAAILKAGGVYLPLDPSHPPARLGQVLRSSGAALALAGAAYGETVAQATGGALPVLALDALMKEGGAARPAVNVRGNNLAYIIHTSGSTGEPKGAMVEMAGMLNNLLGKIPVLGLGEGEAVAQTASQCFDISVWQLLTPLLCGATVAIYPDEVAQDPRRLLAALAEDGVAVLESVPSLIRAVLDGDPVPLPRLRWLLPTGEAFPDELCRRWMEGYPGVRLLNAYGPAECADDVAYYPVAEPPPGEAPSIPIGRPVDNLRLYVLDPQLRPVPVGVAGELCIAGIGVGRGYLNQPALTAQAFVPDPFAEDGGRLYRSGDLARFRPDGVLEFAGRIDHQVKVRGYRIELGEIEAQLRQVDWVQDAVAAVQESRPGDRRLVAYVVLHGQEEAGTAWMETLRAHLRGVLPGYMLPSAFVALDALPLSANGKVDRKKLPAPDYAAPVAAAAATPPRNATEAALLALWQELLENDRFGVHDSFFELGGHSLLAIRLAAGIKARFELEVPLRKLFELPTVAELAVYLEALLLDKLETLSDEEALQLLQRSGGLLELDEVQTSE